MSPHPFCRRADEVCRDCCVKVRGAPAPLHQKSKPRGGPSIGEINCLMAAAPCVACGVMSEAPYPIPICLVLAVSTCTCFWTLHFPCGLGIFNGRFCGNFCRRRSGSSSSCMLYQLGAKHSCCLSASPAPRHRRSKKVLVHGPPLHHEPHLLSQEQEYLVNCFR
jgi:hypothetical protein